MKKSLFMMALGAIVALTSCQPEQSQLDFNNVSETATVQGYVYINQGYTQDGATFVAKSVPAAGCGVLVKVPYTAYDADAADGYKYFEAECNEQGFYQIQVPVGQKAISGVKVYTRPLVGKYNDLENGAIVEKNVSYPEVSTPVEVERGKVFTAEPLYVYAEGVDDKAVVKGYVFINKGYVKDGSSYVVKNLPAEKTEVLVTVNNVTFVGMTNNSGFYTFEIPVGKTAEVAKVATRPTMGTYFDLVNDKIVEKEVTYNEASQTATLERGKDVLVADLVIVKGTETQILTRNQSITLKGEVKERYEKKEYIDKDDTSIGYYAIGDKRPAMSSVKFEVTFTNSAYPSEKIMYNISSDAEGKYELTAKLYDTWDIAQTRVTVEAKSYLSSMTHFYDKWTEETGWKSTSQEVTGYFAGSSQNKDLSDGDLLIGTKMSDFVLTFVPDKNSNIILGITGEERSTYFESLHTSIYFWYEQVNGVETYRSCNPLNW